MRRLAVPLALAAGVLWCWAVLRLLLEPDASGPLEGAVAVGGWGLGVLPVHCAPHRGRRKGRAGAGAAEAGGRPDAAEGVPGPYGRD
ncbi:MULTISPECIES: hypothetical protein [Streptomyces]|uniref:hypothetical protein n=1 Tax=Streptomyces TaxID=1883 RepID=UPI00163CA950|nr:hypothetical protein [Streptomyces sp. WAC05292]